MIQTPTSSDYCSWNTRKNDQESSAISRGSRSDIPFYQEIESTVAELSTCDFESLDSRIDAIVTNLSLNNHSLETLKKMEYYRGMQEHKIQEHLTQTRSFDFIGDIIRLNPHLDRNLLENTDPNLALAYYVAQTKIHKPQYANIGRNSNCSSLT